VSLLWRVINIETGEVHYPATGSIVVMRTDHGPISLLMEGDGTIAAMEQKYDSEHLLIGHGGIYYISLHIPDTLFVQHQAGCHKDKHGTQLWEGDILTHDKYPKGTEFVIKWDNQRAQFVAVSGTGLRRALANMASVDIKQIGNALLRELTNA